MSKKVTRYQCEYCDEIFRYKREADKHENTCIRNPKMHSCYTCYCRYVVNKDTGNERITSCYRETKVIANCRAYVQK